MKKALVTIILLALIVAFAFWCVIPYIRNEYVNACRHSVYTAMQEIKAGVLKYQAQNENRLPPSLDDLVPQFLAPAVLHTKPRYRWLNKQVLVPESPYGIGSAGTSFEITCNFLGDDYTQVVFNASTEEVRAR
jgi:hypothetical protein